MAFDNGPGNMLIDALAPIVSEGQLDIDRDGELSARGRVLPDVLARLLDDEYLRRKPPKSTGRERYGVAFAQALLQRYSQPVSYTHLDVYKRQHPLLLRPRQRPSLPCSQ